MITLDTAKRLKNAGFPQRLLVRGQKIEGVCEIYIDRGEQELLYPSTDELLAQLPKWVHSSRHLNIEPWPMANGKDGWMVQYWEAYQIEANESLPEALAEMYILLKQKGIIK